MLRVERCTDKEPILGPIPRHERDQTRGEWQLPASRRNGSLLQHALVGGKASSGDLLLYDLTCRHGVESTYQSHRLPFTVLENA